MAITKINTPELLDINTTGAKQLPSGTTAQRPTAGLTAGDFRYNTTDDRVEYYDGSAWFQIDDEALPVACTTDTINYPSGTTNTVYYKMSDATDSTLNGYNGTATDVDFNVQGKFGNAAEFNLSNSKINLPQTYGAEGENFSYSFWFKTTTSGGSIYDSQNIISKRNGANTFHLNITNANTLLISDWTGTMNKQSSTTVTDGVWRHVVFTYNNSSGLVYINGSVETSMSFSVNLPTQSISLGNNIGNWDGTSRNFGGSIDQVRIFSTTLTEANALSLYNEVQCVPAIIPSDYFNTLIWTGDGISGRAITVGFQPDMSWYKSRNNAYDHNLSDSVRGAQKQVRPNRDIAEVSATDQITAFTSTGLTLGNGGDANSLNKTYVAWNWKAAATTTTIAANTVGNTIASDVRASTESGFSVVSYTGNNVAGATIGHGLGAAPDMIILKNIDTTDNWTVQTSDLTYTDYIDLNSTNAATTNSSVWYAAPTSTVFSFGANPRGNGSGNDIIAYCFASIPGFSDIGSYIGTGTSGNSIVTGFAPAFVMFKNTTASSTNNWIILDNKRSPSNQRKQVLEPNTSDIETTETVNVNFLSNGFELTNGNSDVNDTGSTYIYLAIAEQVYNANGVTANQTNPFNDGSQVAQYEFEDNADDSQPNGYIGKGGTFNGTSSVINIPLNVVSPASAYTVSLWFNCNDITVNQGVFTNIGTSTQAGEIAINITGSNQISIYSATGTNNDVNILNVTPSTSLSNDSWFNLVVISDRTLSNRGQVFINGTEGAYSYNPGPGSNGQYSTAKIGVSDNRYFDGSLDQVRIYNTALNSNDAWLLYSETSATSSTLDYPASKGAQALYELEGNANDTGGTYNGTETNVAWVPLYDGTPTVMTYAAPSVSTPFLKAGVFNGSSSYIQIANNSFNYSTMSFSGWVNPSANDAYMYIFQNGMYDNRISGSIGWYVRRDAGGSLLARGYSANSLTVAEFDITSASGTIPLNTWTNVVCVLTPTSFNIYVNGNSTAVASASFTNPVTYSSTQPAVVHVGSGYYYNNAAIYESFWEGKLDQVRIFNKALDEGEVLQLYNEPNN